MSIFLNKRFIVLLPQILITNSFSQQEKSTSILSRSMEPSNSQKKMIQRILSSKMPKDAYPQLLKCWRQMRYSRLDDCSDASSTMPKDAYPTTAQMLKTDEVFAARRLLGCGWQKTLVVWLKHYILWSPKTLIWSQPVHEALSILLFILLRWWVYEIN